MMWITENLQVLLTKLPTLPTTIKYGYISSKFGRMLLGLAPIQIGANRYNAVCLLYFVQKGDREALEAVRRRWPNVELYPDAATIDKFRKMLFCDKENAPVLDVAVLGTDFQFAVWSELIKLKVGETCTYKELAERVGRPKAVRATASAVARNEVSVVIPCHRIVSKTGAMKYAWGATLKKELLDYEKNI